MRVEKSGNVIILACGSGLTCNLSSGGALSIHEKEDVFLRGASFFCAPFLIDQIPTSSSSSSLRRKRCNIRLPPSLLCLLMDGPSSPRPPMKVASPLFRFLNFNGVDRRNKFECTNFFLILLVEEVRALETGCQRNSSHLQRRRRPSVLPPPKRTSKNTGSGGGSARSSPH